MKRKIVDSKEGSYGRIIGGFIAFIIGIFWTILAIITADASSDIDKILKLPGETVVYPGHGGEFTISNYRRTS